jgi:hypothetical protein
MNRPEHRSVQVLLPDAMERTMMLRFVLTACPTACAHVAKEIAEALLVFL